MMWVNDCLNASMTGGNHPSPIGVTNDPLQLLPNNKPYRMASNNYYLGHARLLTMMTLSIDPSDDLPLNASAPRRNLAIPFAALVAVHLDPAAKADVRSPEATG